MACSASVKPTTTWQHHVLNTCNQGLQIIVQLWCHRHTVYLPSACLHDPHHAFIPHADHLEHPNRVIVLNQRLEEKGLLARCIQLPSKLVRAD